MNRAVILLYWISGLFAGIAVASYVDMQKLDEAYVKGQQSVECHQDRIEQKPVRQKVIT
jgi:hypothetical protein